MALHRRSTRPNSSGARQQRPARLTLETLEDRLVLSSVTAIREATGPSPTDVQSAVTAFQGDLGGGTANANVANSFGGGRREINWDGTPAAFRSPNPLPAGFFNSNSPRGVVFTSPGTGFQVSGDAPLQNFANINPEYVTDFQPFSPTRLFTPIGSNVTEVRFFIPGTSTPATTRGFGAVFTDVDVNGSTQIQYFDRQDNMLFQRSVQATPGNASLSFLGVAFDSDVIARVVITTGNGPVGAAAATPSGNDVTNGGPNDVVVMDDFLYGEPIAVTLNTPAAQTALAGGTLTFGAATSNPVTLVPVGQTAGAPNPNAPVEVMLSVQNGTLALASTNGLVFSAGSGSGSASLTFRGSVADVNAALTGLVYTPAAGFSGKDALTVRLNDFNLTQTVPLTVQPRQTTINLDVTPTATSTASPVTLTATVAAPGGPTPAGTVTFFNGSTTLGSATLDAGGKATFAANGLPAGSSSLTAVFTPANPNLFAPVTSGALTVTAQRVETVGQFDPVSGNWFLRNQNSGGPFDFGFVFGLPGWNPVVGDWNGDGVTSVGIVDPTSNTFFLRNENSGGLPDAATIQFGMPTWLPLAGHWAGASASGTRDGIGVYDPATSTFFLRNTLTPGTPDFTLAFGSPGLGLVPVAGDWDGTGTTKIGVYDPLSSTFFLRTSNDPMNPGILTIQFGPAISKPVVGDFNGDGITTIGVFDITGNFFLRNSNTAGAPDVGPFPFGLINWKPVAGNWGPAALPLPLLAAGGEGAGAAPLSAESLGVAVDSALSRLSAAQVGQGLLHTLRAANYLVGDLPAGWLGATYRNQNVVVLSADAAGWGWSGQGSGMRLDAALLHEMGHLAGLADDAGNDLMAATLTPGQARVAALDALFAAGMS